MASGEHETDLKLSEDALRLDLPGVSAAHQVVLQHGAGGEGQVTHLALHQARSRAASAPGQ